MIHRMPEPALALERAMRKKILIKQGQQAASVGLNTSRFTVVSFVVFLFMTLVLQCAFDSTTYEYVSASERLLKCITGTLQLTLGLGHFCLVIKQSKLLRRVVIETCPIGDIMYPCPNLGELGRYCINDSTAAQFSVDLILVETWLLWFWH